MRFEKTTGDLSLVGSMPPRDVGLYEIFNIMLDLLLDVRTETGREPSALPVNADAAAKWIAVANALLSVPIEADNLAVTEHRAKRLTKLQNELRQKSQKMEAHRGEIDRLLEEEQQMNQKLHAYEQTHARLLALEEKRKEQQAEAEELEKEIAALDKIDFEAVSERRRQLLQTKAEKQKRLQTYTEYAEQLNVLLGELEQTNSAVADVSRQIDEAAQQHQAAQQTLRDKLQDVKRQQEEADKAAEQLEAETDAQQEVLIQKQKDYAEACDKLQALREKKKTQEASLAAVSEQTEALHVKIADIQKSIADGAKLAEALQEELDGLTVQKEQATAEQQALNGDIKTLKWETEEIQEAAKRHADKQAQLTALQQEIRHLHAETEALQQEKLDCAKNKEQMENKLTELNKDIRLYQEFFDSDECKRTQLEIDRLGRIAHLYQDGVKKLFNGMTPPAEHLGNLRQYYYEMRSKLSAQLAAVRGGLDTLSTGYLDLIARIEKEVNG